MLERPVNLSTPGKCFVNSEEIIGVHPVKIEDKRCSHSDDELENKLVGIQPVMMN